MPRLMTGLIVATLTTVIADPANINIVQSSELQGESDQWKSLPPLQWGIDQGQAGTEIVVPLGDFKAGGSSRRQEIMGFGAAFTDTSAYNAMVWMNSTGLTPLFPMSCQPKFLS
jgi:hypothetical protein